MTTKPDQKQSPFPTSENHGRPPADAQPTPKKPGEVALDEGIEESFPASDPVSVNVTKIKKPADRKDGADRAGGDQR
jgi:hypothetical protein